MCLEYQTKDKKYRNGGPFASKYQCKDYMNCFQFSFKHQAQKQYYGRFALEFKAKAIGMGVHLLLDIKQITVV